MKHTHLALWFLAALALVVLAELIFLASGDSRTRQVATTKIVQLQAPAQSVDEQNDVVEEIREAWKQPDRNEPPQAVRVFEKVLEMGPVCQPSDRFLFVTQRLPKRAPGIEDLIFPYGEFPWRKSYEARKREEDDKRIFGLGKDGGG